MSAGKGHEFAPGGRAERVAAATGGGDGHDAGSRASALGHDRGHLGGRDGDHGQIHRPGNVGDPAVGGQAGCRCRAGADREHLTGVPAGQQGGNDVVRVLSAVRSVCRSNI